MAEEKDISLLEGPELNNYFPGATRSGKLFNINGMVWLIREPVKVWEEDNVEYGWDANNLTNNAAYHFFTESEIKEQQLVIQEI